MDTRLFDMLHDPGHDSIDPVTDGVHIHFDRIFQEFIDQDGMAG